MLLATTGVRYRVLRKNDLFVPGNWGRFNYRDWAPPPNKPSRRQHRCTVTRAHTRARTRSPPVKRKSCSSPPDIGKETRRRPNDERNAREGEEKTKRVWLIAADRPRDDKNPYGHINLTSAKGRPADHRFLTYPARPYKSDQPVERRRRRSDDIFFVVALV